MVHIDVNADELRYLLSPKAIRERSTRIYEATLAGQTHFEFRPEKMGETVRYVVHVTKNRYPDLHIPFFSRWMHFRVGDTNRVKSLDQRLDRLNALEKVRSKIDLAVVSIFLDFSPGEAWRYHQQDQTALARLEGVAVATFEMFKAGVFSKDPENPYRVDAETLINISEETVARGFQSDETNPIGNLEKRHAILKALGETMIRKKSIFNEGRPGDILQYLFTKHGTNVKAGDLLASILRAFDDVRPGGMTLGDQQIRDIWEHPLLGESGTSEALIPFHKMGQLLAYSLIHPLMDVGVRVKDLSELTGLAGGRNGTLFLDIGLIVFRDPEIRKKVLPRDSEAVVEWRALTVVLLDQIAASVRQELDLPEKAFPVGKVLEGGTWWAGRQLSRLVRPDGSPPIWLEGSGMLF